MAKPKYQYGDPAEVLDRKRAEKTTCKECRSNMSWGDRRFCVRDEPGYPNNTAHDCKWWKPMPKGER